VTVGYDFAYDGGKPGSGGTGSIFINGRKVATGRIERTIQFIFGAETADVGEDLYTPVTADYAKGNNKFTGKIDKVTINLKKMTPPDEATAEKAAAKSDEDDADSD
jgi:arylsulfatase